MLFHHKIVTGRELDEIATRPRPWVHSPLRPTPNPIDLSVQAVRSRLATGATYANDEVVTVVPYATHAVFIPEAAKTIRIARVGPLVDECGRRV